MARHRTRLQPSLLIAALSLGLAIAAARASGTHPMVSADLIGTWRLISIVNHGPAGAEPDAFYGSASEGLLIYDRSGWFSVQIMSRPRPHLDVPSVRPEHAGGADAAAKEGALDSYYAYYGTWTYDPSTSTVNHHATGALYPSEEGATYSQRVQIDGSRMTFTRSQGHPPHQTVQVKTWDRVVAP